MKISGKDDISKYINQTVLARTEKPGKKALTPAGVPPKSEGDATVSLSQRAREVLKAHEAIQSEPDIRSEKVSAIKESIKNGTYEIDYGRTAEKILEAFSEETI
jgi:flagellar biosynthesis anti-sigma factor FlgM